jgi:hypothetical protein
MRLLIRITALLLFFSASPLLHASNPTYTYAGAYLTGGYSMIKYSKWSGASMNDYKASGDFFSPGCIIQLYAQRFVGEFTAGYMLNFTDTAATKIDYTEFTSKIKYRYILNQSVSLTAGPGLYFNTPPSTKTYSTSGGGLISVGAVYEYDFDWKAFSDIYCSFGNFGVGNNGARLGFGISFSVLKKFGRF